MSVVSDSVDDSRQSLWQHARRGMLSSEMVGLFAPGRIEVLGKHTDYCGGRSLICAVERGICMAGRRLPEPMVRLHDLDTRQSIELPVNPELTPQVGHWSNYPATVLRRLVRNFPGLRGGADIRLCSNLPRASGLSSSSALITGLSLLLARLSGLDETAAWRERLPTPEKLAAYLGTIENGQSFGDLSGDRGVGTFGGSQDHVAILCGKAGQLSQYSFAPVRHERDIPMPSGYTLLVGSSGVAAEKTGEAMAKYNEVSLRALAILEAWNRATGRCDVCLAQASDSSADAPTRLGAIIAALSQDHRDLPGRLRQYMEESGQIIPAAGDALLAGNLCRFGQLVAQSHVLADTLLHNQVPQTNALVRIAVECGAVAASAFGAGFGGSVWALVPSGDWQDILACWHARYASEFPAQASSACFFHTSPAAGLQWLK